MVQATPNTLSTQDAQRLDVLLSDLNPGFTQLAARLNLSPRELLDWLTSNAIAERLAAFSEVSESLNHLLSLGSRTPALAAAHRLLNSEDPIEQRRITTCLLRTSAPANSRRHDTPRSRAAGDPTSQPALPTAAPAPTTAPDQPSPTRAGPAPSPRPPDRVTPSTLAATAHASDRPRPRPAPSPAATPAATPATTLAELTALIPRSRGPSRTHALLTAAGAAPPRPP